MSHAVRFGKRGDASSDSGVYAGDMSQEREAPSSLGRKAEEAFDRFCNQVLEVVEPLFRGASEE